jgi:dipeptidyl aminopeptidase/acylaminoacyl peptidase
MPQPLTPEVLVYGFTPADDPRIAPDGSAIIFTLAQIDRETRKPSSQLWICDRHGDNKRQLTFTGERNGGGRWSPDGTQIAFISDRVKQSGIFVIPAAQSGEARELTRHNQGISDLNWSPDGAYIAYTTTWDPDNPDEKEPEKDAAPKVRVTRRIDYKQDNRGYLHNKRLHIWLVDVASGERRRLTQEYVDHAFPQWSPDGKRIAAQVSTQNGLASRLTIIDVVTGSEQRVSWDGGVVGSYAWSPDGERIIFTGDTSLTFQLDFFVYDVASGEIRRLTDDLESLPVGGAPGEGSPSNPVWIDDRQVLFHAVRGGGSGLWIIDSEGGAVEPVQQWQAMHSGMSVDAGKRYVVQGRTSLDQLGEIAVYDSQTGESRVITDYSSAVLAEHPPAQWERFDVQRDPYTIEAWLLKPPDFDPTKRYPLIIDIHGGPNGFFGYAMTPQHQSLATDGFVVVFANPRGSTSYGRDFTQQVTEDWGGEDYQDLMAVVDKASEHPWVDAERLGVCGYSYGGYMTAWIIGQTHRFKAAVCGAPCFDLESMYGTSDISHAFGKLQWGGPPHLASEWYAAHSPSTYAHRATTPTLIIHGEADERCPIGQAEQMFVALTEAGCEVEFARYPGGSHAFRRSGPPEHREDCWQRTLDWFKAHLGEPA